MVEHNSLVFVRTPCTFSTKYRHVIAHTVTSVRNSHWQCSPVENLCCFKTTKLIRLSCWSNLMRRRLITRGWPCVWGSFWLIERGPFVHTLSVPPIGSCCVCVCEWCICFWMNPSNRFSSPIFMRNWKGLELRLFQTINKYRLPFSFNNIIIICLFANALQVFTSILWNSNDEWDDTIYRT